MSENAEATEKVAEKKPAKKAAKKAPAKKAAPRKPAVKKAAKKRAAKPATAAAPATAKRGRPAGKKAAKRVAGVRRGKKGAKQFAYLLLTAQDDGSQKASTMNGPFATEANALDDARPGAALRDQVLAQARSVAQARTPAPPLPRPSEVISASVASPRFLAIGPPQALLSSDQKM